MGRGARARSQTLEQPYAELDGQQETDTAGPSDGSGLDAEERRTSTDADSPDSLGTDEEEGEDASSDGGTEDFVRAPGMSFPVGDAVTVELSTAEGLVHVKREKPGCSPSP